MPAPGVLDGDRDAPRLRRVRRARRSAGRRRSSASSALRIRLRNALRSSRASSMRLGAGRVVGADDLDAVGRARGRGRAPDTRRAAGGSAVGSRCSSGGRPNAVISGDDARQVVDGRRDLPARSRRLGVAVLRAAAARGDARRAAGRPAGSSARGRPAVAMRPSAARAPLRRRSSSCVLRMAIAACEEKSASSSRSSSVGSRPSRRLDHERARRPALDDQRRGDDRAALAAAGETW